MIGQLIQGGIGLAQGVLGAIQAAKGRRELKKEIAGMPKYKQSQGILDYYNQALQRYNVAPTESALYKRQMQNIGRQTASGISALQDRRSALAGVPSLVRGASDAALNAEVAAEQQKAQRFGQLGGAAQMKRGEEAMAYQQNEVAPSQMRMQLAGQKAAGGSQIFNTGLSNIFGAGSSLAQSQLYKQLYGTGTDGTQTQEQVDYNRGIQSPDVVNRMLQRSTLRRKF